MDESDEPLESRDSTSDARASVHVECHESETWYTAEFDQFDRRPTDAIMDAVSKATGTDLMELPSLYSVVDPDALDQLLLGFGVRAGNNDGAVSFDYTDCRITLKAAGVVIVEPTDEMQRPAP